MYHIVHYTNYPDSNFDGRNVKFCFLEGSNKSHTKVFKKLPSKKVKNRDVELIELSQISDIEKQSCQLLFVGKQAETDELFTRLQSLNEQLVSVGETRDFIEKGGMITIVPLQSKMKIFFSQEQYENTALKFSSALLKRVNFR